MHNSRGRGGFSLIELLVVISIIALLAALLMPAVQQARETARRTQCMNNLKQLGHAIQAFHDSFNVYPPSHTGDAPPNDKYGTWFVVLLPYLEQTAMYSQFDLTTTWDQGTNPAAAASNGASIAVYKCPTRRAGHELSDNSPQIGATGDYAVVSVVNPANVTPPGSPNGNYQQQWQDPSVLWGAMLGSGPLRSGISWQGRSSLYNVTDGTSNTLLVGEKHMLFNEMDKGGGGPGKSADGNIYVNQTDQWWECHSVRDITGFGLGMATGPNDANPVRFHQFGSWHPGICQFLVADGTVRSINVDIDLTTLTRLGDRRDGSSVMIPQ